jgi:hypothetical protein
VPLSGKSFNLDRHFLFGFIDRFKVARGIEDVSR